MTQATGPIGPGPARAPSRLPGWTRGHVLSRPARNAEGGTRLLTWADAVREVGRVQPALRRQFSFDGTVGSEGPRGVVPPGRRRVYMTSCAH